MGCTVQVKRNVLRKMWCCTSAPAAQVGPELAGAAFA